MAKNKLFFIAALAGAMLLTGCSGGTTTRSVPSFASASTGITFSTVAVKRGDIEEAIYDELYYRSINTISLSFSISGTLDTKTVNYRTDIKKGDVLATLAERDTYGSEITKKKQELLELGIRLEQARVGMEGGGEVALAQLKYQQEQQTLDSLKKDPSTDSEQLARQQFAVDSAKLSYDELVNSAAADYKAVSDLIDIANAELDLLQTKYDACTLVSPVDGECVYLSNRSPGEDITAFSTFVSIADTTKVCAALNGDDGTADYLALGDKVTITINDVAYNATVIQIPATQPTGVIYGVKSDVRLYFFDIEGFDYSNATLGSAIVAGSVKVSLRTHTDTLYLESYLVDQADDGSYSVNLLVGNSPITKPVTVGIITNEFTEITSGLSEGDLIVHD